MAFLVVYGMVVVRSGTETRTQDLVLGHQKSDVISRKYEVIYTSSNPKNRERTCRDPSLYRVHKNLSKVKAKLTHTLSVLVSIHLNSQNQVSKPPISPPKPHLCPPLSKNNLLISGDSLHNSPPLLLLLLLSTHTHHLAIISHGGSGLVHVALEGAVEPAADHAGRVSCHFGVARAALAVVFAAALVSGQVVEKALGGGGGLRVGCQLMCTRCGGGGSCGRGHASRMQGEILDMERMSMDTTFNHETPPNVTPTS